jgi:hypothetical protein
MEQPLLESKSTKISGVVPLNTSMTASSVGTQSEDPGTQTSVTNTNQTNVTKERLF